MSQSQYGSNTMDRQQPQFSKPGSVRAARERMMAQLNPGDQYTKQVSMNQYVEPMSRIQMARQGGPSGIPRNPRPQGQTVAQQPLPIRIDPAEAIGVAISQPIPIQQPIQQKQWPFPQPNADGSSYQPPPGRSMPPPRPPRPSKIISMVENNQPQLQLHVPPRPQQESRQQQDSDDYYASPQDAQDSDDYYASPQDAQDSDEVNTAYTPSSRPSVSSFGSIPDFPVPVVPPPPPPPPPPPELLAVPRRSTNLGPPPSSRRGASSFYSTQSYVEPIPEEASSQISRSHGSFASSMAIPDDFESDMASSPGFMSDEDQMTPNSYGSRPEVIVTGMTDSSPNMRLEDSDAITPTVNPFLGVDDAQFGPHAAPRSFGTLNNGNRLMASPSLSATRLPISNVPQRSPQPVTPDHIRQSLLAAAETKPELLMASPTGGQREYSLLSAIRRPPALDIGSANGRNSTTTLPDMIRRATRLATLIDKGKRPASSAGDPEFVFVNNLANRGSAFTNGRQSGLSDMLAAFPPPAAQPSPISQPKRTSRIRSIIRSPSSWPFPPGRSPARPPGMQQLRSPLATTATGMTEKTMNQKRGRRCCGLPLWGFITLLILLLVLAAAAAIVPLEFFVFRKGGASPGSAESDTNQCSSELLCLNDGTSVMLDGQCLCICINGFTGDDCSIAGATGCTTTTLVTTTANSTDSISNVTLGLAIPRLIVEAQTAYSVPLSGTEILARFNSGNLSCIAQNSLVTFDGSATRISDSTSGTNNGVDVSKNSVADSSKSSEYPTITVPESLATTVTAAAVAEKAAVAANEDVTGEDIQTVSVSSVLVTTVEVVMTSTLAESTSIVTTFTTSIPTTTTLTMTSTITVAASDSTFSASQDSIDFARVAVLFVLQKTDVLQASAAQAALEDFFTRNDNITTTEAKNITLGNSNFINLVNFGVTVGTTSVGSGNTTSNVTKREVLAQLAGDEEDVLFMGRREGEDQENQEEEEEEDDEQEEGGGWRDGGKEEGSSLHTTSTKSGTGQ